MINGFITSVSKGRNCTLHIALDEYCNAFIVKSYLRIFGSLEVGQQQADKHRALLLLAHESADPKKQDVNNTFLKRHLRRQREEC